MIYESLRSGRMHEPLMECLAGAGRVDGVTATETALPCGMEVGVNGHNADSEEQATKESDSNAVTHEQSITNAIDRLSLDCPRSRRDSIAEAVRNHSIDTTAVAEEGDHNASLSLTHGSLSSL
ncbi:MAG: hypothetical protein Q9221_006702 [Calogaya cf. arnoldii]